MKTIFLFIFVAYMQTVANLAAQTTHNLPNGRVIFEDVGNLYDITRGDTIPIKKNSVLIKFSPAIQETEVREIENINHLVLKYKCMTGWTIYNVPDTNSILDLAGSLLSQIDSSEFSFNYLLTYHSSVPLDEPNDPQYINQWYLENIRVPEAWQITTGDPKPKDWCS